MACKPDVPEVGDTYVLLVNWRGSSAARQTSATRLAT
jgi:hypothetical protein